MDQRTEQQKQTHTVLIGGKDSFMSGWGKGTVGSYAYWACEPEHQEAVEWWVGKRDGIKLKSYRERPKNHTSIYPVDEGHPAVLDFAVMFWRKFTLVPYKEFYTPSTTFHDDWMWVPVKDDLGFFAPVPFMEHGVEEFLGLEDEELSEEKERMINNAKPCNK